MKFGMNIFFDGFPIDKSQIISNSALPPRPGYMGPPALLPSPDLRHGQHPACRHWGLQDALRILIVFHGIHIVQDEVEVGRWAGSS